MENESYLATAGTDPLAAYNEVNTVEGNAKVKKPSRNVKRRASQACQGCRARKIRCDVAKHGVPCVHCKLDNVECIMGENKRRKSVHIFHNHFLR